MQGVLPRNSGRRRVGRYLICGEIASGGMASVHLGRLLGPVGFSKIVAIKRLHSQFATDPEFLSMFIDEARLASVISHPNVVSSLDVVVEGDELLLVMEYVQGETLSQLSKLARNRKAPPSLGVIQRILCDTLDGLHAAHTASVGGRPLNIVHRDISPQNIMVGANGVARVLDFGIAKAESQSQTTRPGRVKGKFAYLSPEQLRGQPVDARTDVFSAGVVLWENLTGSRLFLSDTMQETAERVLSATIAPPSSKNPAVSERLDRAVMTALNREPQLRHKSAAEFADALRAVPGEGSRAEVSAWVTATAAEILAQRLPALEELEAMDTAHAGLVAVSVAPAMREAKPLRGATVAPPSLAEQTLTATTSRGTRRPLSPNRRSPGRRRTVLGLGATLLVGLLALIATVAWPTGSMPPSSVKRGVAEVSASARPVLESSPAPTPNTALTAAHVAGPESAVDTSPAKPPKSVVASTKPQKPVAITHNRVSSPVRNCNPPYRIDASGVRRVRFECL